MHKQGPAPQTSPATVSPWATGPGTSPVQHGGVKSQDGVMSFT